MKSKLLLIVYMAFSIVASSQSVKTLEYNVGTGTFTGLLPFDQPFNLKLTNIPKGADSLKVLLIEVPKKNYHAISAWKKKNRRSDWKIITAKDAIDWKPDGIETFQFLLDKVEMLADTFHTLAVPFYLKPESKYLIDIRSYTRRDLTEAETEALVKEIKNYRPYKDLINQLILKNINDPDAGSEGWGEASRMLRNMAEQAVKAKHPNYVLNDVNYEILLGSLSKSLIAASNLSGDIDETTGKVKDALNDKTTDTIKQVSQRHKTLQDKATNVNWPKAKDAVYKSYLKQLNSTLYSDSLLLDKKDLHLIAVARNNILQTIKDARAEKLAGESFERDIAKQLIGLEVFISSNLQKNDIALLKATKDRYDVLKAMLNRVIWVDLKDTSRQYKNFINKTNDALTEDGVLLPAIIIANTKNNLETKLNKAINAIEVFNDGVARATALNAFKQGTIGSTNSESLVEQAKLHVTFDLGYAYVWQIDRGNAYAGINIYFRSIDTSLPLKNYKANFLDFIGSRASLLVGMSVQ